ncbi:N-acetyltransferase [Exophiala viscosa]|uniref:N-acetyltransferase n=1 Tax=Exophiala viscosa TaxID=2486360 RepID=A0AAN6DVL5_9EURO|nr:N-acetyltransferase [Exophiala viscosa]KAI1619916.1 N-acetyltransferase [Exophiala viscosa]
MPSVVYPYTVTNSHKGGLFMRTYSRNVRRAWDGEDYRPPKRQRLEDAWNAHSFTSGGYNENMTTKSIDLEDSLERAIRETSVAALSSSPSRKNSTVFSAESREDDVGSTITPPSSPPPTLQLTPPNVKARKPTFSFMDKSKKEKKDLKNAKRKRDAQVAGLLGAENNTRHDSEPLSEIFNNSTRAQGTQPLVRDASAGRDAGVQLATGATRPSAPKQNLVQTVLDLGQPLAPTTCAQCQMSYMPTLSEDAQLHDMFHHRDSSGIELGKPFLKSAMRWCYQVPQIPGSVVVVDRKLSLPARRTVQKLLSIVSKELGSVEIKEEELWSQRALEGEKDEGRKCDRYKVFLHIIDEKCVGVCLAERITKAHRVLPIETATSETLALNDHFKPIAPATPAATEVHDEDSTQMHVRPQIPTPVASPTSSGPSSSISISEETYPAVVGVSRIWTSRAFRHKGIANNLLECVMHQFIYGMEIEPLQVAFSQPTESGAALARAWFGEGHGWAVYREE